MRGGRHIFQYFLRGTADAYIHMQKPRSEKEDDSTYSLDSTLIEEIIVNTSAKQWYGLSPGEIRKNPTVGNLRLISMKLLSFDLI